MKVIVALLLLLAAACRNHEDTGGSAMWRRIVEPRLSATRSWKPCIRKLSPGHAVIDARCEATPLLAGRCDEVVSSREEADRMLVGQPLCTDAAIAALENFSRAEPAAMSDLAGAYYVRAQRKDDPSDLLNAFDAARKAITMTPRPPGAHFNYALILEALSLNADAIQAWQRAAEMEEGDWANEARTHRAALVKAASSDGARQWAEVRAGIDAALDAGDAGRARGLIAKFPATSQKYFEEEVLRQWAASPSPRQLARATTFADALSQFFNDRYFIDVAAAMTDLHSRQGHLRFAEARHAADAVPLYGEAARLLREGRSPQWLPARIAYAALKTLQTNDYAGALKELDALAADARRYPSVMAYLEQNRLFLDQYANRYNDFFASYDAAKAQYGRIGDWEDRAAVATHSIATMSVVGLAKPAWREAFVEMRDVARLPSLKTRFLLVGATVDAALGLRHAEAALLYQSSIVESARNKAPGFFVSILDHRARIEAGLGDYGAARRDLDDAGRVAGVDPRVRQLLEARLAEAEGEAALHADPRRAVDALTRAIGLAAPEYATFRAALFAERAEAFNRAGTPAQAEADRREALNQLHAEEEATLRGRKPGKADDLWISYFSRFEETYDLLIRQLIDNGRADEAFRYAERARAYEPLDLVRRLPAAPAAFRELAAHADHVDIDKLQAQLPPNTFLIEYRVFEDQTYAWILGRNVFTAQRVPARRGDVKRWTAALQNAASAKDSAAFDAGLEPPYDGLLRAPLEVIRRWPGGGAANIVIVPDRELRGLPFAALRDPDTKRYVIEDHTLSMSGSALLYVFAVLRDRELAARDTSALLIADPAFDPKSTLAQGLQRLQYARQEAGALHSLYPDSEVLIDGAATPERFLELARGKAIIHIAAHGVVNGDAPSQSFLLFNGLLTAEMLVKDLHAGKTRLVVLGACSSAGGLAVGAEGIAPLVRPIVGAGVPGVVGALWDIDDATAAGLLVSFHRHYRQGSDAAAALREAQVDMLRSGNPGETPARIWAPYQAIGYASSPFRPIGDINKEKPP